MTRGRTLLTFAGCAAGLLGLAVLNPLRLGPSALAQGQANPKAAAGVELLSAADALRTGQYERALEASRAELAATPRSLTALTVFVRTRLETGAHAEAEEGVRAFISRDGRSGDAWKLLGDVLLERGRLAEAETAFGKAIAQRAANSLAAEASLGALLYERGQRTEAAARFERLVAAYNSGRAKAASDLIAVGLACRYLGASNPSAFKDALKAFDEAAALDDTHEARLRTGELFLEKFNGTEARTAFESILQINRAQPQALLGLAKAKDFHGERGVPDLIDAALATDPNFVEARAYRSGLQLALEDFPAARAEAEKALAVSPASREALSALAAAQYVSGDTPAYAETRRKSEALFPKSAELLVTVAEAAVRNRLYREAAQLAKEALVLDPQSWAALASLAQNQLRLGDIEDARKNFDRSFAGDPYNVWVKNTLDLLDTFGNYTLVDAANGRFRLFLEKKEEGVLGPPMAALAVEAIDKLSERYGFKPAEAIRVEAYPSHADFSVRTVGLAGLGALGVCFGPVVVIDSPQARDRGSFNWGSTLWHELTHVITMGASGNRVPRWLTEGISVYEERRARPGWGDDLSLEFLLAYKGEGLLPLKELNNGFVRPKRPEQVSLSYYQASLVVEHIEARYGIDGLRKLLKAYSTGAATPDAFQTALGRSVDQVDEEFQAALKTTLAKPLAGFQGSPAAGSSDRPPPQETRSTLQARLAKNDSDFLAHLSLGRLNHRENRDDEALTHFERAAQIWPESAGEESPYFAIAEIKQAQGDQDGAIAALRSLVARNENTDTARSQLSTLLEAKGRTEEALGVLDSAVFIYPFDPKLHERRALLATRLQRANAVREARRALVELNPVDKAEAYFQLAVAELEAGDRAAARRSVLRALEVAPRFARAQELLLKIHREEKVP